MLTPQRERQGFTESLTQHAITFTLFPGVRGDGVTVDYEVNVDGALLRMLRMPTALRFLSPTLASCSQKGSFPAKLLCQPDTWT